MYILPTLRPVALVVSLHQLLNLGLLQERVALDELPHEAGPLCSSGVHAALSVDGSVVLGHEFVLEESRVD